jgi:hypothetical protein
MRTFRVVISGLATSMLLLAVSPPGLPAAPLSPLMVNWPSYFRIEWQTAQARGRTVIQGTLYNTSTRRTGRVQLLIDGLDASGAVVNQHVEWLGTELMPGDHVAFQSPTSGPAASYRVSVFAFDPIKR